MLNSDEHEKSFTIPGLDESGAVTIISWSLQYLSPRDAS